MTISLTFLACLFFTAGPETVTLRGKVVELAGALKAKGLAADPGPIAGQVALVTIDGSIIPLISDESSRAFFLDKRMRDRETEILGRKHAGVPYLQVGSFKIVEGGKLQTPEYYCEVCSISVRYPQDCPCCQGPLILRMKPQGD
jgi:hypothetical protein